MDPSLPTQSPENGDETDRLAATSSKASGLWMSRYFLDDEGLRPVWGILLFLLLWNLLRQFVFPLAAAIFPSSPPGEAFISLQHTWKYEFASIVCAGTATWLMARLEARPIKEYGFRPGGWLRNFALGLATGGVLLSALVSVLTAAGFLIFDKRLLFGSRICLDGALWGGCFLLVALAEETLLRGYLQFTLTRMLCHVFRRTTTLERADSFGFWGAAVILSIAFGGIHTSNPGESPLGLINAALVGLVFCLSLRRTGSLWWAIGFHAAWDWAQSFLFGVADSGLVVQHRLFATHVAGPPLLSGGLTGPEGSVFVLPVIATACVVVVLTLPRARTASTEYADATTAALDLR